MYYLKPDIILYQLLTSAPPPLSCFQKSCELNVFVPTLFQCLPTTYLLSKNSVILTTYIYVIAIANVVFFVIPREPWCIFFGLKRSLFLFQYSSPSLHEISSKLLQRFKRESITDIQSRDRAFIIFYSRDLSQVQLLIYSVPHF